MLRARLALLSLLATTLAMPASAQNPTDTAVADTVPKKKSRFGGMMDKAKQVAGNKAVQGAVKGAASNVACTVVPGAAVVGAATGSGPCANTLGGIMNAGGGAKGAAAAVASGAAAGAASKAMSKMSGAKGAAATGALNSMGGTGGVSQAAAAAAAARVMQNGGAMPSMSGLAGAAVAGKKGSSAKLNVPAGAAGTANMAEAMAAMGAMGAALGTATANAKKVETVDFRELKAMLPESLRGLKRTSASGEKSGAMGLSMSSAEGHYSSDDGKSVNLTIADIGSLTGLAGMAAYAWATTEVDRESDNGYEKTTTFKGYRAIEKYDRKSRSGEMSVLVGGRFVVGAEGDAVDMDALKSALGSVDLRKLNGMKGRGVK